MSAHTPGPWEAHRYGTTDKWAVGPKQRTTTVDFRVADVYSEGDANLIAAVPDLLHELRAAAAQIEALGGDARTQRAVIAKATGKAT